MQSSLRPNLILAIGMALFALATALFWIPLDSSTGFIEKVRRQITIGDALAPTVACGFILLGAVLLLLERNQKNPGTSDWQHIRFGAMLLSLLLCSFVIMWQAGPLVVKLHNWINNDTLQYRLLRDTVPWKYSGFVSGGVIAIAGTICLTERRFSLRALVVAIVAVAVMILIYDLPFDDLLLPPNGDY